MEITPKTRGWLIFAGIIAAWLSMGLLRFRMKVLFSKAGMPLLLIGVLIIVLTLMKPKKKQGERGERQ
jgi:hypothetical protein